MQNLAVMRNDIRTQYEMSLSTSHYGHPSVVGVLRTGRWGRPRLVFDPNFLEWAITQWTSLRIASFLTVVRTTLHQAMLDHGLAEPGNNPFLPESSISSELSESVLVSGDDDILESKLPPPLLYLRKLWMPPQLYKILCLAQLHYQPWQMTNWMTCSCSSKHTSGEQV